MRDSGDLGQFGENFKAYTYTNVMYLIMYREVFTGSLAEMFWWDFAKKFAMKARGCAGMAPWTGGHLPKGVSSASDRCLYCGERGHRASDPRHQLEGAEGSAQLTDDNLNAALSTITKDRSLNAEQKKHWKSRIRAFWGTMRASSSVDGVP